MAASFVVVTDRGGHLHNAKMLLDQMGTTPDAFVLTRGPEVEPLRQRCPVYLVPYLHTWIGKWRLFNPFKALVHVLWAGVLALRLRPKVVVSTGATQVVFFCYWARLIGARIVHVECMNQVWTPSLTGKMLYPIATDFYTQWEELLPAYGPKAKYGGWVL